jgi:hypothetical protein
LNVDRHATNLRATPPATTSGTQRTKEFDARFYESLSSALVSDFEVSGMEVLEKLALEKPA